MVGELVAAFGEPRCEEHDAIVVALHVIEAAALPPARHSRDEPSSSSRCFFARSAAVVWNHDSTGSNPDGIGSTSATQRRSLGISSVNVTLMRSPALNVVPGTPSASFAGLKPCATVTVIYGGWRTPCRGTYLEDPVRRALQARHVEERAGPLLREGQGFDSPAPTFATSSSMRRSRVTASAERPTPTCRAQLHLADLHERGEVEISASNRR